MPAPDPLLELTRRHFFERCRLGLGSMALASLANEVKAAPTGNPLAARSGHFPARAKSVIYLFMAGGPSQFELFDHKPALREYHGQPIPDSFVAGKRFAFMSTFSKDRPKLLATRRRFAQHGESGAWVSECLPHTAGVVDDLAFLRAVVTEPINHAPAKLFANTGSQQFGRPSMGSWVTYGIGSMAEDLPGFVVLQSGPRGPRGGAVNWGNGMLPSTYQGVPLRNGAEPILDLSSPPGIDATRQRRTLDAIRDLNSEHLAATGDPEIAARINSYEMAYRMQTSAPRLIDLAGESKATLDLYGADPDKPSFGLNCLLARRLAERGVRFINLYHEGWDHHSDVAGGLKTACGQTDRGAAALIVDLKRRGLLDDTLVVWGGEFGRTPMVESNINLGRSLGRDHHPQAFTMWFAGGGIKPGQTMGRTDDLGFHVVEDAVHVHDVQATLLHLLGLDHTRLTYRHQGRDFRLTDVSGTVVKQLLA
jgi:hypothetical protein